MNSVSMPSRPASRARAASRSISDTEHLLPALGLARGGHAGRLEHARRGGGAAVDGGLGEAQAPAPERREQEQEERAPMAAAARAGRDRERRDDAEVPMALVALLPQRGADDPLRVVHQEPQSRIQPGFPIAVARQLS